MREYFSFCGDIKALHVYDAKNDTGETVKEALIKFETESGATTACLITGALVEGRNIVVEVFSEQRASDGSHAESDASGGGTEKTGVAAMVSEGKQIASEVGKKVSEVDEQLGLSQGVKKAFGAGAAAVKSVDERLQLSEKAGMVAEMAKQRASHLDEQFRISERATSLSKSVSSFLGFRSASPQPTTSAGAPSAFATASSREASPNPQSPTSPCSPAKKD